MIYVLIVEAWLLAVRSISFNSEIVSVVQFNSNVALKLTPQDNLNIASVSIYTFKYQYYG